jgi:hypothetical protein
VMTVGGITARMNLAIKQKADRFRRG